MIDIKIQSSDFEVAGLHRQLQHHQGVGAVVDFTGCVRPEHSPQWGALKSLQLEHYPQMTENSINAIVEQAFARWPLLAATVVHRVGLLPVGDNIVYVGVASAHRRPALEAVGFIMDFLKNDVPIWKKAVYAAGEQWIEQKTSDVGAKKRWQ